jgi:hypothetical protein
MSILVLGDSIAKGLGLAMKAYTIATVGMGSCGILQHVPSQHFPLAVISAGVNDPPGPCVDAIRNKINADHVVWIRPVPYRFGRHGLIHLNDSQAAGPTVDRVAAAHGDKVVTYVRGRDGVHPANYNAVANSIRG